MITKHSLIAFILAVLLTSVSFGNVTYTTADLGTGRWQYTYDVTNSSPSVPIEEFTIWFDRTLYDDLAIETSDPPASGWDELVWQPDTLWSIDGGYDALALGSGIGVGQTVSGFAVSFDWLGTGEPGPQLFEIIDSATWQTVSFGMTLNSVNVIPAPGALLLGFIGTGAVGVWRRLSRSA